MSEPTADKGIYKRWTMWSDGTDVSSLGGDPLPGTLANPVFMDVVEAAPSSAIEHVTTKHGFKARLVTPEQEAALDNIADDVFQYPIVKVNVMGGTMEGIIAVYVTDGESHTPLSIIHPDGSVYPL